MNGSNSQNDLSGDKRGIRVMVNGCGRILEGIYNPSDLVVGKEVKALDLEGATWKINEIGNPTKINKEVSLPTVTAEKIN
jgi:hypothetical protein